MVKPICLAAFIKILCDFPVILLILPFCECTRSSVVTHKLSTGSDALPDRVGSRQINFWWVVHQSPFNLLVFDWSIWLWYANLEIIIPLVIKYRYFSDVLLTRCIASYIPLIEYRYSHQIICGLSDSFELLSDGILCFRKFLWLLPLTHDAIGKLCLLPLISCTIRFVSHDLQACVNYSWSLWYMFLRCPNGLDMCLP